MVAIDTDVLLLAFAFQQDKRQAANQLFLQQVQTSYPAITVYTLMELLGKLSFNLSTERLEQWSIWLIEAYRLTVLWPTLPDLVVTNLTWREELFTRPFQRIKTVKMPYMDALILDLVEQKTNVDCFVTWNARHFQGKSMLPVLTPAGYLSNYPQLP